MGTISKTQRNLVLELRDLRIQNSVFWVRDPAIISATKFQLNRWMNWKLDLEWMSYLFSTIISAQSVEDICFKTKFQDSTRTNIHIHYKLIKACNSSTTLERFSPKLAELQIPLNISGRALQNCQTTNDILIVRYLPFTRFTSISHWSVVYALLWSSPSNLKSKSVQLCKTQRIARDIVYRPYGVGRTPVSSTDLSWCHIRNCWVSGDRVFEDLMISPPQLLLGLKQDQKWKLKETCRLR